MHIEAALAANYSDTEISLQICGKPAALHLNPLETITLIQQLLGSLEQLVLSTPFLGEAPLLDRPEDLMNLVHNLGTMQIPPARIYALQNSLTNILQDLGAEPALTDMHGACAAVTTKDLLFAPIEATLAAAA